MSTEREGLDVEQQLIDEIVQKAECDTKNNYFYLTYGQKRLRLKACYTAPFFFITRIDNMPGKKPQLGETTILYKAAKKIMEGIVGQQKHDYNYGFSSDIPAMIKWAKTKGREIFRWEDEVTKNEEDDGEFYMARATIHCEKKL